MTAEPSVRNVPRPGGGFDCLFLAGGRGDLNLANLVDRLGLMPKAAGLSDTSPLTLHVGDSRMIVHQGCAAVTRYGELHDSGAALSIGDAATDLPGADSLIAIELIAAPYAHQAAHLAAVQQLCVAAVSLGSALQADRLFWPPAQLWSPFAALTDAVVALQEQGLPPVLHLVAMRQQAAAAGVVRLGSRGLAHFCGVELALDHPAALAGPAAVQRLARLVIHAMVVGPLQAGAVVAGIDAGERLVVGLSEDGTPPVIPVYLQARLH